MGVWLFIQSEIKHRGPKFQTGFLYRGLTYISILIIHYLISLINKCHMVQFTEVNYNSCTNATKTFLWPPPQITMNPKIYYENLSQTAGRLVTHS